MELETSSSIISKYSTNRAVTLHTYEAFKYHWFVWQFCGLKYPKNHNWKLLYTVYAIILNATVTLFFPLTLIVNCFLSENFTELCENLYITITDVICNLKFLNVFIVRKKLLAVKDILDRLDTRAKTDDEIHALRMGIRSAHKCFCIFAIMFGCAIITSQLVVYLSSERTLMYPAWLPLNWKTSYRDFLIAHSYQVYGLTVQAIQDLGNDTYPQAYLRILCAHIEALSLRISKLGNKKGMNSKEVNKELIECIKDHQIIIELHKTIQQIISTACLAQFMCTGLAQCTIGVYMLYVGLDFSKLLNIVIFFTAVTFEIFILCHFGDQLCQRAEQLTVAIYSCNWMDQNKKFKQALLLLLKRSQRPLVIMAGDLIPLKLPTFVRVMKTAYSTFAVLSEVK
ncbi:odorant receptor 2a-like [Episyrphus balteatus]|uniref:odorant receptor 2a-like n=1 Tax=Episyrphus balteatus TaxID=286459 RepID=UPI002486604E|nr:odorant receptor 2a-like [Episyrphus balteatus]